jgi:hypothetical protein
MWLTVHHAPAMVLRWLTFAGDSPACPWRGPGWRVHATCRAIWLAAEALGEVTLDPRGQVADVEAVHAPAN